MKAIIPDHIIQNIAKNGTDAQKRVARRTLALAAQIRQRRLAPVPTTHIDGENRVIYDAQNGTNLPGVEVRVESDPAGADQAVNEAFDGCGDTFKFYDEVFSRVSVDGKGMLLNSSVHYDKDFDNAYWDGSQMVYGDGSFFNRFTIDLTVMAHELTHGVTQFTANLDYQDQPGALNEHASDVFGVLVEQYAYQQTADKATWLVGQKLCEGKVQGRALRDMLNPGTAYDDPTIGKDPQVGNMKDYDHTWQDGGGVHINSGIPNKAFATACVNLGGFAWEKMGRVWYGVLASRATNSTNFQEWADLTFIEAGHLFGDGGAEQKAVVDGWAAVGITASADTPAPTPAPGGSPCVAQMHAILQDPNAIYHLLSLGKNEHVRRLLLNVYQTIKRGV